MLAKEYRLPSTISFKSSKIFHSPLFTIKVIRNNLKNSRFGFIAGKKLDKRAVVRNKTKRKVRDIIEKEYLGVKNLDLLFLLKTPSINSQREEIRNVLESLMAKIQGNL
ncbi:MAG TPA: ribonuclease P protein component [Patescibacteria group bacterium]